MFEVEFIGGPYDGHKELLGSGPPAEELAWIVGEDVFRLLAGKNRRKRGRITSVAIYELEVVDGELGCDGGAADAGPGSDQLRKPFVIGFTVEEHSSG